MKYKNKIKTKLLLLGLLVSVIISMMILVSMVGCAGNQVLRGTDYTKTERPEDFPERKIDKTSFLYQVTPHVIWGTAVIGLGFWLWKDYTKSRR